MFKKLLLIWGRQFLKPTRAAELLATLLVIPYFDEYSGIIEFFLLHPGQIFQSIPMFKLGLEIEIRSLNSEVRATVG